MNHPVKRLLPVLLLVLGGCGYAFYAEPLRPLPAQAPELTVFDDGSVVYMNGRLEVRVRPMTEEELNRRFEANSAEGPKSTNPYTYGDAKRPAQESEDRFTVFYLKVKNYEFPKVLIDPERICLEADNGRQYWALSLQQLSTYYRAYAQGYAGNEYARLRERSDVLNQSMYHKAMIFSGQEADGYLVFRSLHADVASLTLTIHDLITRFDYRDEPVEARDVDYRFGREVGRVYPDRTRRKATATEHPGAGAG